MSTAVVSRSRFDAMVESKNKSIARAREVAKGAQGAGWRPALATLAGNAAAGVIDAKMGEGTSSLVGVAVGTAGVFLRQPDLVAAGTGLLGPAVYRATRAKAEEYFHGSSFTAPTGA